MYRFKKTFEDVYTAPSLQNIPFHVIAGNHDHCTVPARCNTSHDSRRACPVHQPRGSPSTLSFAYAFFHAGPGR